MAVTCSAGESIRLRALHALNILDSEPEPHLDAVCRTAAGLFDVPIAAVPLVDEARLWFKASLDGNAGSIAREGAFCDHTIRGRPLEPLVVADLAQDARFARTPLVLGPPFARFYAGVPFTDRSGQNIGTICVIDVRPRPDFGPAQAAQLQDLARIVEAHLRLHEANLHLAEARGAAEAEVEERRRVEALLAEREARLRTAQESREIAEQTARFGHWRIDVPTQTITWSAGTARVFGRVDGLSDLPLARHLGFYHPDDRPQVARSMAVAGAGLSSLEGGGYGHRSRILRPDGEVRTVAVHGIAERDAEGRVTALHGVCLDVTEPARSEQQQRETSELLRTTLENMDQGLIMLGPDARVRIHNRRACELLELPAAAMRADAPFDAAAAFPELEPGPSAVQSCRRPNGTSLEVRTVPLADGGVVRTFTDVSERVAVERALRASRERLKASEERLAHALDSGSDGLWDLDLVTGAAWFSDRWHAMLGYGVGDLEMHLRTWRRIVHPEDAPRAEAMMRGHLAGASPLYEAECRLRRKDGHYVWVLTRGKVVSRGGEGRALRIVGTQIDISRRKEAEDDLRLSEERLALALDSGNDGLWDWSLPSGQVRLSGEYFRTLGYEPSEMETRIEVWSQLVHPEDAGQALRLMRAHLRGELPLYECEYRMRTKSGGYRWTLARGKIVARDPAGRATRIVGTYIDVTQRKEAEQQIAHMAVHDALTGLPNRVLFRDRLNLVLSEARRTGGSFAVLACDLDRFKAVNDTLGHPAGDALLRTIADRLRGIMRGGDTVARLGGDEFAIILGGLADVHAVSLAAERVIEAVGQPVTLDGQAANVGVSIGIALGTGDGPDADALFKNADIALYRAKAAGRNTFSYYEPGMDLVVAARNMLERDLRAALTEQAFEVHYQPIVEVATGRVTGAEALLRWRHPTRGLVPPAAFVPVAEETGLIAPIGAWVLQAACREAVGWPGAMRVAVNVSAVQFQQPGLFETVAEALACSGLAPDRLELEITESVLMQDATEVTAMLHRLRSLGVRTALDDFGTGYSSLSYLRRFPFDKLKLDRSFVQDLANPGTAAIVRAVVSLGTGLGMTVTAEGVETVEQRDLVLRKGCGEVQGYFYSRPLPTDALRIFLARSIRGAAAA